MPPKGNMPESVTQASIKNDILKPRELSRYQDKNVIIKPTLHVWRDAGQTVFNGIAVPGKHDVVPLSGPWPQGIRALETYLIQHHLFKSYVIENRVTDKQPAQPPDYTIEFQYTRDMGEPDTVGSILCGLTLGLYPLRTADEHYYRVVISDGRGKTTTSHVVLAKRKYFTVLNIFVPFLWGDNYDETTWPGPVFSYLLENAH